MIWPTSRRGGRLRLRIAAPAGQERHHRRRWWLQRKGMPDFAALHGRTAKPEDFWPGVRSAPAQRLRLAGVPAVRAPRETKRGSSRGSTTASCGTSRRSVPDAHKLLAECERPSARWASAPSVGTSPIDPSGPTGSRLIEARRAANGDRASCSCRRCSSSAIGIRGTAALVRHCKLAELIAGRLPTDAKRLAFWRAAVRASTSIRSTLLSTVPATSKSPQLWQRTPNPSKSGREMFSARAPHIGQFTLSLLTVRWAMILLRSERLAR